MRFRTEIQIPKSDFKISHASKIMAMGSCFVENVGQKLSDLRFDIRELARVIELVNNDELSSTNSKQVIEELFKNWGEADIIVDENNLRQENDVWAMEAIVEEVIKNNPRQVEEYKAWKQQLFAFFVGQCMKVSKGQWNPKIFNELLRKKLDS